MKDNKTVATMKEFELHEEFYDWETLIQVGDPYLVSGRIREASVHHNVITLVFDECTMFIADLGQQCCESRYITTDDDLTLLVGARFYSVQIKPGGSNSSIGGGSEKHEVKFLDIVTSAGTVTFCTHNEHNGYYGGFDIKIHIKAKEQSA